MIIIHNANCSKCREAVSLLEGENCQISIREYMNDPLTVIEIEELIHKIGCKAEDLVRKDEKFFVENFSGRELTEEAYIKLLAENPVLLQRPIVIDGEKAIIGRPPVLVLELVK